MSGRFVAIIALLAVSFAYCEAEEETMRCWCELFWARKIPLPATVTFRMAMFALEDETLTPTDCQQFSTACLEKCTSKLETDYHSYQLGTRHDPRFQLGKMMCSRAGVGISAMEPRKTFLQAKVPECSETFNYISLGDLCCYKCLNDQNVVQITYNPDCDVNKYPPGRCDI